MPLLDLEAQARADIADDVLNEFTTRGGSGEVLDGEYCTD